MPRIRSKQILGEVPVNQNDLTTKKYVDDLFASGSTGGSSITILDENTEILSGVTSINFLGVDVKAEKGGNKQVNVYIPSPDYVPYFNTSSATVDNVSTTNRNISSPTSEGNPYKIGDWTAGTSHPTIRNSMSNLVYSTNSEFSILNLSTTFTATVYDADGTSVLAEHTITLDSNQNPTSNGIAISVTDFDNDFDRYKANVTVTIQISSILTEGGRFSISLKHDNDGDIYEFNQNNIFRDSETLSSSIDGTLTVVTGNTIQTKQISGVYFYTTNTQWHVYLDQINNLNSRTYPLNQQLLITDNNLFISENISINGNDAEFISGTWSNLHDVTNTEYEKLDWTTDQINETNWDNNGGILNTNAEARIYDWAETDNTLSINYNYLIDTFEDLSDRNSEMFRSEDNSTYPRLQDDLITPWDNTQPLTDGLQVIGDRLVYPQYNFTQFEPQSSLQPEYSLFSGNKTYYRQFETDGSNVSNGYIKFIDFNINESDLSSNNIMLDISINGTDWFSLNKEYTGYNPLFDGDGCRINLDQYGLGSGTEEQDRLNYTLGSDFANSLYLRITYTDSAKDKYIGGLDFVGQYWA